MTPPERRASDTAKSFAALCDLAAMGPSRSLEKYRLTTGKSPAYLRQLERWSSDHAWMARLVTYDTAVAQSEEQQRAAIRAERRAALEEADWADGQAGRLRMREILAEIPKFIKRSERDTVIDGEHIRVITLAISATPGNLMLALKTASELQRLSVGVATEQIDSHQTIEITYVNDSPDNEAPA